MPFRPRSFHITRDVPLPPHRPWAEGKKIEDLRRSKDTISDIVVLVHGTFAAEDDENGTNWWQVGGDFTKMIQQPGRRVLQFHWSGLNSEVARMSASIRLWLLLFQIEELNIPFSIVGHSHGGQVVWTSLQIATMWYTGKARVRKMLSEFNAPFDMPWRTHKKRPQGNPMPHLKRWITVGTPFLVSEDSLVPFFRKMLLAVILFALIVLIGAVTGHGAITLTLILAGIVYWLVPENLSVGRDVFVEVKRMEKDAWKYFGPHYRAIWSEHDEAISGLKATLTRPKVILPRLVLIREREQDKTLRSKCRRWENGDKVFLQATPLQRALANVFGPGIWLGKAMFDLLLIWPADQVIWWRVQRAVFGNDLGLSYVDVRETPLSCDSKAFVSLEAQGIDLSAVVNSRGNDGLSYVRTLLRGAREPGIGALLSDSKAEMFLDLLVHTYYFDNQAVTALIASELNSEPPSTLIDRTTNFGAA